MGEQAGMRVGTHRPVLNVPGWAVHTCDRSTQGAEAAASGNERLS